MPALQKVLIHINIDVTYMGSGVKADHSFSSNSGLDMARLQAAMTVALNVELDEIQTKLALFGVEDFKRA